MAEQHGATTIKAWLEDLTDVAREGRSFATSAGADPRKDYAYLEYHFPDGAHSILLFRVEQDEGDHVVRAYRFDGSAEEIREQVGHLTRAGRESAT